MPPCRAHVLGGGQHGEDIHIGVVGQAAAVTLPRIPRPRPQPPEDDRRLTTLLPRLKVGSGFHLDAFLPRGQNIVGIPVDPGATAAADRARHQILREHSPDGVGTQVRQRLRPEIPNGRRRPRDDLSARQQTRRRRCDPRAFDHDLEHAADTHITLVHCRRIGTTTQPAEGPRRGSDLRK